MEQPDHSSTPQLPLGVDPSELYSGPSITGQRPATAAPRPRVVSHPASLTQPIPPPIRELASSAHGQGEILSAAFHMLGARVLGVLSLVAACAIWGYTVYDPLKERTIAATLFSVTVLFPVIALYWRDYWRNFSR